MRADIDHDDTNGKVKSSHQAGRRTWSYAVLLSGFCVGFLASQLLYLQSHQQHIPNELKHRRQLQHGVPASELEKILQQVAPEREVMIAISNYNLIQQGMLTTWLEVSKSVFLHIYTALTSFILSCIKASFSCLLKS